MKMHGSVIRINIQIKWYTRNVKFIAMFSLIKTSHLKYLVNLIKNIIVPFIVLLS